MSDNNIRQDPSRFLCIRFRVLNIRYTPIHSLILTPTRRCLAARAR